MHRDAIPSLSFAPEYGVGVDWNSLLDAMGTLEFDNVLQRFLSKLIAQAPRLDRSESPRGLPSRPHSLELSHRIIDNGDALTAIVRKHMQAVHQRGDHQPAEPLASLNVIERCLADCTSLPRRELEVCTRILFGMSSAGIAIDLDLSEATVKTYRKRAYQRLSIGCERELITWYLRRWTAWQHPASMAPSP